MSFSVSCVPMMTVLRIVCALLLLALVAGCAPVTPAPVIDMTRDIPAAGQGAATPTDRQAADGHYIVRTGDTLYSIAFRNQLDWKRLARWNGIVAPYTIQPGEDLRLSAPPGTRSDGVVTYGVAGADDAVVVAPVADDNPVAAPVAGDALATTPPPPPIEAPPAQPPPAPATTPDQAPPAGDSASSNTRAVAGINWQWPVQGTLLRSFAADDPTRQGIDIAGQRGEPVRAAADGTVVYSGNGLPGYGELIIIKHSDAYLSAYGHNDKRLVNEGDTVQAGEKIATMGSTGTNRVELHFEIRKHGQPVDPQGFLPQL